MIRFTAVRDWARSYQLARWVSTDKRPWSHASPGTYPHDAQLDYLRIADHPPRKRSKQFVVSVIEIFRQPFECITELQRHSAAVIIDHQEPVTPRTLLDRNALGLEFRAQRIQRGDRSLSRFRLDVQGNEHQPLANLLRPRVGQDKRAALPVDLCDMRPAVLVVAPGAREAEPINVKAERGLNIRHV